MSYENEGSQNEESSKRQPQVLPLLWDPILPLEVNLNRLKYEGIFDITGRGRGSQTVMDEDKDTTKLLSVMDRTTAELNSMKNDRDEYLGHIATIEEKNPQFAFPPPPLSVLTWIQRYLQVFFSRGSQNASQLYIRLQAAVRCQRTTIDKFRIYGSSSDQVGISVPRNSTGLSMALVLVLAASPRNMYETLKRFTPSVGEGPEMLAKLGDTPSQSLRAAMTTAKAAACGPQHLKVTKITAKTKAYMRPKITVLGVNFVDISYLKNSASIAGFEESHTSFSRNFVIAAGPEGYLVWQGDGNGSYGLDEYINRGSDRIRDWSEAPRFLADFEGLAVEKVRLRPCQVDHSDYDRREAGTQRSTSGSIAASKSTLES